MSPVLEFLNLDKKVLGAIPVYSKYRIRYSNKIELSMIE